MSEKKTLKSQYLDSGDNGLICREANDDSNHVYIPEALFPATVAFSDGVLAYAATLSWQQIKNTNFTEALIVGKSFRQIHLWCFKSSTDWNASVTVNLHF